MDYEKAAQDNLDLAREAVAVGDDVRQQLAELREHVTEIENQQKLNLMVSEVMHRELRALQAEVQRIAVHTVQPEADQLFAAVLESEQRIAAELGTFQVQH